MGIDQIKVSINNMRVIVIVVIFSVIMIYLGWFYIVNEQPLSKLAGDWGAFGDFFGGILNPIIAFFAFWWLTKSVMLQKSELSETREALISASEAQEKQAATAEINAKLQVINMQLEHMNIIMQSELLNRNNLISETFIQGSNKLGAYVNYSGGVLSGQQLLIESNERIRLLNDSQKKKIQEAAQLTEVENNSLDPF